MSKRKWDPPWWTEPAVLFVLALAALGLLVRLLFWEGEHV